MLLKVTEARSRTSGDTLKPNLRSDAGGLQAGKEDRGGKTEMAREI